MIPWHRLFGLALTDFFTGSPFVVELEKDLSFKRQLLDVVVLRRLPGEVPQPLPDGLGDLADHNLLSYRSLQEPLDDWAMDELVGHYVNYRKLVGIPDGRFLPPEQFRLYAVSTRYPQKLADQVGLERSQPGVYEARWGTHRIPVLVLSEMSEEEHNAIWLVFSAVHDKVRQGAQWYHSHTGEISTVMNELYGHYKLEGIMPYTWEDFRRDYTLEHLDELTPEERLRGLPPEERLRGLPPEERLRGLPPEEILKRLPVEEILKRLPVEEIEAYLARQDKQRKRRAH